MAEKFKGIIKLTEEQYNTLKTTGSITVDGTTYTFDQNTFYVTEKKDEASTVIFRKWSTGGEE